MNKETLEQLKLDCGVEDLDIDGIINEAIASANYGIINSKEGFARNYKVSLLAITLLQQENEKLKHYKLLYQKVKDRNDKAIEYIKEQGCYEEDTKVFCDDLNYYVIPKLLELLKGNNEE